MCVGHEYYILQRVEAIERQEAITVPGKGSQLSKTRVELALKVRRCKFILQSDLQRRTTRHSPLIAQAGRILQRMYEHRTV